MAVTNAMKTAGAAMMIFGDPVKSALDALKKESARELTTLVDNRIAIWNIAELSAYPFLNYH
jgi:hypothetical protein